MIYIRRRRLRITKNRIGICIDPGWLLSYYIIMGKSNTPDNMFNNKRLAAYQKTMGKKDDAEDSKSQKLPPSIDEGLLKTTGKSGLVKTRSGDAGKKAEPPRKEKLPGVLPGETKTEDSKYRRVAKFLILIGREEASQILSKLDLDQVEEISREISSIRGISQEEAEEIFDEFKALLSLGYHLSGSASGGIDAARRILYAAFGPEKGESFLRRTVPESIENPFNFLEDFSGEQVAFLLKEESPATAALVLSRVSPKLSAACLAVMNPARKLEVVKRVARLGETIPEILDRVAQGLKDKAHTAGKTETTGIDGRSALTAILKHTDTSFGEMILDELEEKDPELSQDIKERLHTLEDVVKAEDKPLQLHLRSMNDREIALLLKGKSGEFTEKILSNLSSNRRTIIKEEMEIMGPASKRDVDAVDKAFLSWFRNGREEGRIVLIDDEDVIV